MELSLDLIVFERIQLVSDLSNFPLVSLTGYPYCSVMHCRVFLSYDRGSTLLSDVCACYLSHKDHGDTLPWDPGFGSWLVLLLGTMPRTRCLPTGPGSAQRGLQCLSGSEPILTALIPRGIHRVPTGYRFACVTYTHLRCCSSTTA